MAQVRKYNTGGIFVDGVQLSEEQINNALTGASAEARAQWADTLNAARSGQRVDIDSNANSVTGGLWDSSLTKGQQERNHAGRLNDRKKNRHATFNTDIHNFNVRNQEMISRFREQSLTKPEETKEETKLTALGRGNNDWFTFGEDGTYSTGPANMGFEKILREGFKYYSSGNDYRKGWDKSAYDADGSYSSLDTYFKNADAAALDVESLIERVKTNKLSDVDREVLGLFGFKEGADKIKARQDAAELSALKQEYANAGYDYDTWGSYIEKNDKGQWVAKTLDDGRSVFSSIGNGNFYFNDKFADKYKNLDFLKGHFLIDNVLYKDSDAAVEGSELYNYLRNKGGFYDLNKSGDWEGANRIIRHLWDGETNNRLGSDTDVYSEFLQNNPNYRWASLTGAYDTPLADGEQLLEIYDPNSEADQFGYTKAKYAIIGKDGKARWIDSPGNLTGKEAQKFSGRKVAKTENPEAVINGLVIDDLTDKNGKPLNIRLFRNPENGDWVYRGRIRGVNGIENMDYKMPAEIAEQINKKPDFWDTLSSNPNLLRKFEATIGDTINSGFRSLFTDILDVEDWESLGFNGEYMFNLFKKYRKNKKAGDLIKRRDDRLIGKEKLVGEQTQEQVFKNGGKVLPKFQPGGSVKNTDTHAYTQKKLKSTYVNPNNFTKLGQPLSDFHSADYWELGALAADLGSIFAPRALGVVGTGAGFIADVTRDGLDWGDIGNLGLGLGLDAAALIPGLGNAAQAASAVKRIRKAAPVIAKLFAMGGIGQGATVALNKIVTGDEWDMRDLRTVASAVVGGVQLSRSGLNPFRNGVKTSVKGKTGEITVKINGNDTKVTLNDNQLKSLEGKTGDDAKKLIKKYAAEQHGVNPKQVKTGQLPTTTETTDVVDKRGWKVWKKEFWHPNKTTSSVEKIDYKVKDNIAPDAVDPNTWSGKKTLYNERLKTVKSKDKLTLPSLIPFGQTDHVTEEPEGYVALPTQTVTQYDLANRPRFAKGGVIKAYNGLKTYGPASIRTNYALDHASTIIPKYEPTYAYKTESQAQSDFLKASGITPFNTNATAPVVPTQSTDYMDDYHEDPFFMLPVSTKASEGLNNHLQSETANIATKASGSKTIPVPEIPSPTRTTVGTNPGKGLNTKIGDYLDPILGAAGMAHSINQTNQIAQNQIKANNEAAAAMQMSMPQKLPLRHNIDAGNAYENEAKRQIQALPTVNSDYLRQAAIERVGKDAASQYLMQRDLANSQQHSQNIAWNTEAARMYNEAVRQTEAHNRQVEAQRIAANSQAETARRMANGQSWNNANMELRQRLEQAKTYANSKQQLEGMYAANDALTKFKNQWLAEYNADANKGTKTFDQWLIGDIGRRQAIADESYRLKKQMQLENLPSSPMSFLFAKSGTRIRPAKEQIEINRRKANDQLWINQNKATQKAIDQLNKQAFEFLKMMLS